MRYVAPLLCSSLTVFMSADAAYAQSVRIAVVLDELVDGAPRPSSDVEAAVIDQLTKEQGIIVIDPEQARKVRLATRGSSLLEAEVRDLVTALDADYLLVGEIRFEPNETKDLGFEVHSFTARGRTKLIAVDSAQILGAPRPGGNAFHPSSREAAIARTATDCGEELASSILRLVRAREPRRVELVVDLSSPVDPKTVFETVDCLSTEMAAPARLLVQHERGFQVELQADDGAEALARKFGSGGLCGLAVRAVSKHALRAGFVPRIRTPVVGVRFEANDDVRGRDAWMQDEIPRMLLAEISDLHFTQVDPDLDIEAALPGRRRGTLGLVGSVLRRGDRLEVSARVLALFRDEAIWAETASCRDDDWSQCVGQLRQAISSQLLDRVLASRHLIPVGKDVAVGQRREVLSMSAPVVPDLYPARLAVYDDNPVGTIALTNRSDESVTEVSVFASLERLSKEAPIAVDAASLQPDQTVEVPFQLALDVVRLRDHVENATRILSLRVEYRVGEFKYDQRKTVPVMVYGRNALDWREPRSAAAFVTADSSELVDAAVQIRRGLPDYRRSEPLAMPIALFEALRNLRYAPDRANPYRPDELDDVQFPVETLSFGGGDCDDLAVVYAALLEASGIAALLIQTPGHVLVGVETDVPASNWRVLAADSSLVVAHAGRAWVPVETTKLGGEFSDAWAAGASEIRALASSGGAPMITEIREAWRHFPPAPIYPRADRVELAPVDPRRVIAELERARTAREGELSSTLDALNTSDDPLQLNRLGVILVQLDRLDEARDAFARSAEIRATTAVLNNQGNLDLLDGQAARALKRYEAALTSSPERIEVRLNAVLASHYLASSDPSYAEKRALHVAEAVRADPGRLQAFLRRLPGGELTGSDAATSSPRLSGLASIIQRELESKGHRVGRTVARSSAGGGLQRHLNWLES